jgi:hypothetical protein
MDFRNNKNPWKYSDSSNSPYYNQPTQSPFKRDPFAYVSLLMGIAAIFTYCTLVLPIIFGGLSILFAVLSYRPKKPLSPLAITGIVVSCFALVTTIILLISSIILLQDPSYRAQISQISGVDFDAMLQQLREAYGLAGSTG